MGIFYVLFVPEQKFGSIAEFNEFFVQTHGEPKAGVPALFAYSQNFSQVFVNPKR
jgi:hypothetical protein